ncbi:reverse transcriptase, partial [Phytophthora megakarya]
KRGDSGDPLNYRPLALLNTDYKVFTRILATRVSALLSMQIHPNQNGFVARRTIHGIFDLFEAAQIAVTLDNDQDEAIVLLLDFRKAYDSLDRAYVGTVLRHHEYVDRFIKAVIVCTRTLVYAS